MFSETSILTERSALGLCGPILQKQKENIPWLIPDICYDLKFSHGKPFLLMNLCQLLLIVRAHAETAPTKLVSNECKKACETCRSNISTRKVSHKPNGTDVNLVFCSL